MNDRNSRKRRDLHFFLEMCTLVVVVKKSADRASVTDQRKWNRSVIEGDGRTDSSEIMLLFERRYLGNENSYSNET